MMRGVSGDHPIRAYFAEAVHEALASELGLHEIDDVEGYLTEMLVRFLNLDKVFGIRDAAGQPVRTVAEMIVEGDVRLRAETFDREREVHRHIGDFVLFWSGIFPEFLKQLKTPAGPDALLDPIRQGQLSYYVASTFDHDPYTAEAIILRKLSADFEQYSYGLRCIRKSFDTLAA